MFKKINKEKIFSINNLWWLSIFIILIFFHSSHDLNNDEGIILNGAWNLINGREIFIDFFEFIPPGSFYLIFFVWKIFGVHFFAAKLFSIILVFLGAIGVSKISHELGGGKLSNIAAIPFIISSFFLPIINHNTFSTIIIIWAVFFFLKALSQNKYRYFFASGAINGLVIIFLHQKAMALIAASGLFFLFLLIKDRKLSWAKNGLIYLLGLILPVVLIFLKWPPKLLYDNLIIYPLNNYLGVESISVYLLSFFLFVLISIAWLYRKTKNKKIWFLILSQFFLLLSAYPCPDLTHVILAAFILFSLFPIVLESMAKKPKSALTVYFSFIYLIVFVIILKNTIGYIYTFPPLYSFKYSPVMEFIKENCQNSDYIYAGPFMPGIYFESRKLNPTPFHILSSKFQTEDQFMLARKKLEEYKPACAIINYSITEKWGHDINNPVDLYILNNYQPIFRSGDKTVLRLIDH